MKAILRYKDKVASLGLLPTIITLCGLYFFPARQRAADLRRRLAGSLFLCLPDLF